jgi:hypothetical protein
MKLYSTLISMDVNTAAKLFWRRGKVFVDGFRMCALQLMYMKLSCVQTIWDKIEVLLRLSWGIWGTHWDKGMWKNIDSTFITSQVEASWGVGKSPLYPDMLKSRYRLAHCIRSDLCTRIKGPYTPPGWYDLRQ